LGGIYNSRILALELESPNGTLEGELHEAQGGCFVSFSVGFNGGKRVGTDGKGCALGFGSISQGYGRNQS
jgi:hypothetical protein